MSEGFNPRPKMSLPEPRSVGIASEAEIIEFELADWVNPDAVLERLRRALPQDIDVTGLDLVRPREKARPASVVYEARLASPPEDVPRRIRELLDRPTAPVVRRRPGKDKRLDARPFIERIEGDGATVRMVLRTGPNGTVRPDEVLRLLGVDDEDVARADIRRTQIRLA
jgi:radical SAM-linked protein